MTQQVAEYVYVSDRIYEASLEDEIIYVDSTDNTVYVHLPEAGASNESILRIKWVKGSNPVVVRGVIDTHVEHRMAFRSSIMLHATKEALPHAAQWHILSSHPGAGLFLVDGA